MKIRPFESLATTGRRRSEAGRKAAAAKNKVYQEERPYYQAAVDAYMAKGHSYDRACHIAADDDFVGTYWTIKEHADNRKPMKRGRQK